MTTSSDPPSTALPTELGEICDGYVAGLQFFERGPGDPPGNALAWFCELCGHLKDTPHAADCRRGTSTPLPARLPADLRQRADMLDAECESYERAGKTTIPNANIPALRTLEALLRKSADQLEAAHAETTRLRQERDEAREAAERHYAASMDVTRAVTFLHEKLEEAEATATALKAQLQIAIAALADLGYGSDVTFAVLRRKAKRIHKELSEGGAARSEPGHWSSSQN